MASKNETRVAVFLGGRSPEHDVSVITGLQALKAIDQERFAAFPVYVSPRGAWFVGDALTERRNYLPDSRTQAELTEVTLSLGEPGPGVLVPKRTGLFARRSATEFDVALLAFHGLGGEDGQMQGLFETANVPYTGMRTLASALLMDKAATKRLLRGLDIPLLPDAVVTRGPTGLPTADALTAHLGDREAEARRGIAGFPPEIPVGRRRQGRDQGRCGKQSGHAVADPRDQPGASRRPRGEAAALGGRGVRSGRRHRRAAGRFLLQRKHRRDLAQRSEPVPGLVRLFPLGSGRAADRLHCAVVGADRRGACPPPRVPTARRSGARRSAPAAAVVP